MKNEMRLILVVACLFFGCERDKVEKSPPAVSVTKSNPMKVYMHYMPWFQAKDVSGYWGTHWRMKTKDPDQVDADGKRDIASHYYPLIGPYDSKDADVIEYHLLLMKYAGIDGILIDWYGSHKVHDYQTNLTGANAVIDKMDDVGLQFAAVYEEYTAEQVEANTAHTAIEAARADMAYLESNYYNKKAYIRIDDKPLLLTFGPRYFKQGSHWDQIFQNRPKPVFLPLWNHAQFTGTNDNGEFSWVDFDPGLSALISFYNRTSFDVQMGSAYPRFHDFYEEGGTGTSYGYVPFDGGETLRKTLDLAKQRNIRYLQLVTWNDFGEGTVIEPTLEDKFTCLEMIQGFTGVTYGRTELEMIYEYYQKKKKYKDDPEALSDLKEVFELLTALKVDQARAILAQLP